jgi:hypothetical protein
MMRYLKPMVPADHEQMTKTCAHWFRDELGLTIVEYHLGNAFTGSIDMLATDRKSVFLITVSSSRLEDGLLRSLTGYWWFQVNKDFLCRVYSKEEIDLSLPPVIMILSPTFPPETKSILMQALKLPVRLFRCLMFGTQADPELYIEELPPHHAVEERAPDDLDDLRRELSIERAGLTDGEIRDFQAAMKTEAPSLDV